MYYASFGFLSILLHFIINCDFLNIDEDRKLSVPYIRYRRFLMVVLVYYVTDVLWGFLYEAHLIPLVFLDTSFYFLAMGLVVLLWTRFVTAYLDKRGFWHQLLVYGGWLIFGYQIICLIVNFFHPVLFQVATDGTYMALPGRYITLGLQVLLYSMTCVYSLFFALKTKDQQRIHYLAVGISGVMMTIFITLQTLYVLLPFYSIGCLIATSLVHAFVTEDEKRSRDREKDTFYQIVESLAEDYEAIYYINIETGRYREFSPSEKYESLKIVKGMTDFYRDTMENIDACVHPDDREYARGLYRKEEMLQRLKEARSYSYKYRILFDGQPRFCRFTVMLSMDGTHFVLCEKDIEEEILEEKLRQEKQKKSITFGQIAESLASNYDVIYYVNTKDKRYVGYTTSHIFGRLEVNATGDDFFAETKKNLEILIHPEDRDRVAGIIDRDHLLTVFESKRDLNLDYRMIVDGKTQFTRLFVRKTDDGEHLIFCVENIDNEIHREREHLKALNMERELARRDELTGTKNKTAYHELEQSVQSNLDNGLDYLPFALVVCDLNDLKKINDTLGHKAGDDYIRDSAKLLCDIFDHSPVFRIGGDEFVIFLRGNDYSYRKDLMQKLEGIVHANLQKNEGPVIACGIAEFEAGRDLLISDIFERADNAMYENKRLLKQGAADDGG